MSQRAEPWSRTQSPASSLTAGFLPLEKYLSDLMLRPCFGGGVNSYISMSCLLGNEVDDFTFLMTAILLEGAYFFFTMYQIEH